MNDVYKREGVNRERRGEGERERGKLESKGNFNINEIRMDSQS